METLWAGQARSTHSISRAWARPRSRALDALNVGDLKCRGGRVRSAIAREGIERIDKIEAGQELEEQSRLGSASRLHLEADARVGEGAGTAAAAGTDRVLSCLSGERWPESGTPGRGPPAMSGGTGPLHFFSRAASARTFGCASRLGRAASRLRPQPGCLVAGARDVFQVASAVGVDAVGNQFEHAVRQRAQEAAVVGHEEHRALEVPK
jgi:hypothetical protein